MSCVFCKIAAKEIKSAVVHETENVIAFDDINPQAPVHAVIIPKKHVEDISGIHDVLPEIFGVIGRVVEKKGLKDNGFRVVMNKGKDAGQAVPHLHLHLLGGRQMHWPPG